MDGFPEAGGDGAKNVRLAKASVMKYHEILSPLSRNSFPHGLIVDSQIYSDS
jgi:hypothetical protein